ncbi:MULTISPECIES: hemolysin family protein [Caproicibacterium]|uniref:Hemolysin family protein n=1 Tax=Caproicibacterium argilliputei TaxID=3030016 RepID=A0AA97D9P1_9FIRM|nr:hemolysin family protein [Caproicibacterium argilliputei]WOC32032.1 hemolysin family protein [Caproicibacterium argilliputei]
MAPDPDGTAMFPWGSLFLLAVLILINGFFSASEIAVITLNDSKIRKMAEDGNSKAKAILKLTRNSNRFLATIQVGVTLSGFLSSAAASQSFSTMLADALLVTGLPRSVLQVVSSLLITLVLSYFSLVLGELVPKQLALHRAEAIAFRFAGFLNGLSAFFTPLVKLLTVSTTTVLRLFNIRPGQDDQETVTEEGIRLMVDEGEERGVIEETEKDMISNVLDFDDNTVSEMMTHRTEIAAVEDTDTVQDVVRLSMEKGFSRIPVYHEDLDNILGFLYVKDLLKFIGQPPQEGKLTDLMRPAAFVPETQSCSKLFQEMTEQHRQIAVVVDEYGGTEGLITLEDLLEAIVGSIQDEYDHEEEEIVEDGPNHWSVEGSLLVEDIEDLTGVTLPKGEYETIAGLMVALLGRIPHENEHPTVNCETLTLTALRIRERRIERIQIKKTVPAPQEQSEAE